MKFLFLDMDGVMVTEHPEVTHGPHNSFLMDPECVERLNALLRDPEVKIVLSSDWRLHFNLNQMDDIFKFNQVRSSPISFTTLVGPHQTGWAEVTKLEMDRTIEIKKWLKQHHFNDSFKNYVAVDDMNLPLTRFVQTDYKFGLATVGVYERVREFLNNE